MGDRLGIPSAVGLFSFPWNSSNVPFPLLSMATSMDATSHCHPLSSLCNLPSPVAFLPHSCDIKGLVNDIHKAFYIAGMWLKATGDGRLHRDDKG